ncbi:HesB/YadR/YfhF family protein [Thalassobacillus sp. CUG 92003]|uniref:HesB/YadR/YfhF family protein n=1 Tax=Thalassobacillus sp. CUG 92003 TaxID=2736641 RepID=UPI0015E69D50|nr:HesB/YadR/YfhF family protein [Thalassobacillus sp. CUG 92003]
MNLTITDQALQWFKDELNPQQPTGVRFYVRYGGSGGLKSGFSLGIMLDEPHEPAVEVSQDEVYFFIESKDIWYFDDYDMHVVYNDTLEEPDFEYNA